MSEVYSIEVNDVRRSFKTYSDKARQLKDLFVLKNRNSKYSVHEVLKGVSFKVKKGEAIGLIGKNGCGKSTLLKMLSKILYPTSGSIVINGRVSALIELGAGFHPDMSGRENIYTNASIFGMKQSEIEERVEEIINFSELEDFIDNPVRTYSSGMYMRLAFSVAINVNADILLIDEILAVGDYSFQQKCFEKLKEIKAKGTTIVIVSHSLSQIENICECSYWIEDGVIVDSGIPKYVHERYLSSMENERMERIEKEKNSSKAITIEKEESIENINIESEDNLDVLPTFCSDKALRMGNKKIEITDFELKNSKNENRSTFRTGEDAVLHISYKKNGDINLGNFGIGIYREDGLYCFGTNAKIEFDRLIPLVDKGTVTIKLPEIPLLYGIYNINIAIHSEDSTEIYDDIKNVTQIHMFSSFGDDGLCRLRNEWIVDGQLISKKKVIDN